MNQTAVNGLSIAFDDTGPKDMESPAFLLLPGWCTSRSVFRELAAELSKQRRTLGQSPSAARHVLVAYIYY